MFQTRSSGEILIVALGAMSAKQGTILVVDDSPESLKLLKTILEEEGYQVRLAESGKRALASVVTDRPDLILLDIRMMGMDGFEVFRQLQAREESHEIPVIFLSGFSDTDQRAEGMRLGAVDFISKPIECEELLARVQTHLELHRLRTRLAREATELRRANDRLDELLQTRDQDLREATAGAVRAVEDEQRRIGRDLHDHLCQDLAGLVREIEGIKKAVPETDVARPKLERLAGEATHALHSARGFAHDLALADLGFISLETSLHEFAQHATASFGIEVEVNYGTDLGIHEADAAGHILRIVREAVVNGARHGQASHFWIDVVHKDGKVTLSISNDGDPLPEIHLLKEGLGFRQMQMRARLLGARLTVRNREGGGVQALLILDGIPVSSASTSLG